MLFKFIDGVIEQFHLMIPGKGRATTLIIGIDCNMAVVCHNSLLIVGLALIFHRELGFL